MRTASLWKRVGPWLPAAVLLGAGVAGHLFFMPRPQWQVANFDQAAYRYVAEQFWGVAHDPQSYNPEFYAAWNPFLSKMPFREIGVGTVYLLMKAVGGTRVGVVHHATFIVLWCGAFLLFYHLLRKRFGIVLATIAVALLAFPLETWEWTGHLMSEAYLRLCFVLALCTLIPLRSDGKNLPLCAGLFYAVSLLMVHVKVQWLLYPALMTPVFLYLGWRRRAWRQCAGIAIAAACVPLSVIAVHWIGWGTLALTPGSGLHALKLSHGEIFAYTCDRFPQGDRAPDFCKIPTHYPQFFEFLASHESENVTAYVRALDADAVAYTFRDPRVVVQRFAEGLFSASDFPEWTLDPFVHAIDLVFVLTVLCVALFRRDTLPLAAGALGLWLVPAIANVGAVYDPRYHISMATLPLIVAVVLIGSAAPFLRLKSGEKVAARPQH